MTRKNKIPKKIAGIKVAVLDRINIFLTFETTCRYRICQAAQDYWQEELETKPLPLTAQTLLEFGCVFDADTYGAPIDWAGWVPHVLYEDSEGIYPDVNWPQYTDPVKMHERYAKLFFLLREAPEAYRKLGGRSRT